MDKQDNLITRDDQQNFIANCCDSPNVLMIQYGYDCPEEYDGISEYTCQTCNYRQGRWSGKSLVGEQYENKYGRKTN